MAYDFTAYDSYTATYKQAESDELAAFVIRCETLHQVKHRMVFVDNLGQAAWQQYCRSELEITKSHANRLVAIGGAADTRKAAEEYRAKNRKGVQKHSDESRRLAKRSPLERALDAFRDARGVTEEAEQLEMLGCCSDALGRTPAELHAHALRQLPQAERKAEVLALLDQIGLSAFDLLPSVAAAAD